MVAFTASLVRGETVKTYHGASGDWTEFERLSDTVIVFRYYNYKGSFSGGEQFTGSVPVDEVHTFENIKVRLIINLNVYGTNQEQVILENIGEVPYVICPASIEIDDGSIGEMFIVRTGSSDETSRCLLS